MQTDQISSKELVVVNLDQLKVRLEYNEDFAVLHLREVGKMTKTLYQTMLIYVEDLWEFLSTVGYSNMFIAVPENDQRLKKLGTKLGFKYLGDSEGLSVYSYKEGI